MALWMSTYSLGHTNTGITDGEGLVLQVGDDVDAEVLARVELGGVREGLITDLVQSIGSVGDQLTQENLLVRVDGVNDQRQQLRNLSLELEGLRHCGGVGRENSDGERASEGRNEEIETTSRKVEDKR
jgi:hypothetical protein